MLDTGHGMIKRGTVNNSNSGKKEKEKKTLNMGMTRMRRDRRDGKKWVRKMERKEDT